mgnify:CR=1 FL=1
MVACHWCALSALSPVLVYLGAGAAFWARLVWARSNRASHASSYWLTARRQNVLKIAELGVLSLLFLIGLSRPLERLSDPCDAGIRPGKPAGDDLHCRDSARHSPRCSATNRHRGYRRCLFVPVVDGRSCIEIPVQSAAPGDGGEVAPAFPSCWRRIWPSCRSCCSCRFSANSTGGTVVDRFGAGVWPRPRWQSAIDRGRRAAATATAVPACRLRGHERAVRGRDAVRHRRHRR